ncbi:MAG: universal stress protein [Planctomycetes bacterium]|nr:universal stress protein [Planctomycetota bacterium]
MERILIAVDFSTSSRHVVDTGAALAKRLGAAVVLVHVEPPDLAMASDEVSLETAMVSEASRIQQGHRELQSIAARLKEQGLCVTAHLMQGPPVDRILEEARRSQAQLIVIGTHGHGAVYEALIGSISTGVARKSTCPVMLVPPNR